MTDRAGHVAGILTAVDGAGAASIPLPAGAGPPTIVHARYAGGDNFVVNAVDAHGRFLSIAAQAFANYDGTFPVGFVDQHNAPTRGLAVSTTGPWHLDIANASLAPALPAGGVDGAGDGVWAYSGPAVQARVSYAGTSTFTLETFTNGVLKVLASGKGPYERNVQLPAGPAFVSVTAAGDWSMKLE